MTFIAADAISTDHLDWGELGWVVNPVSAPGSNLTVLDVVIQPGKGHDFHRHPDQEEVITVLCGRIDQWVEGEHNQLGPGDAVHITAGTVHASFVAADATEPAHVLVCLTPSVGDAGYVAEDVADQEPWAGLRP